MAQNNEQLFSQTDNPFRPIVHEDYEWVTPILKAEDSMASTGCFGTLLLWAETNGLTVTKLGERLLTHYSQRNPFFGFPMGTGPMTPSIDAMLDMAKKNGNPFVMKGVTPQQRKLLENEFPGEFSYSEDRSNFDYIYRLDTMASLAGKKLQKRRNMCNRFMAAHAGCHLEVLEPRHFTACMDLMEHWTENHGNPADISREGEDEALTRAFSNYENLHLEGGVLAVDNRIVAFTIGELTGQSTFDIHFEKADKEYDGAFCMINREFARHLVQTHPSLQFVNREEDMGLDNLRKAKESYRPEFLLEKYTVRIPGR